MSRQEKQDRVTLIKLCCAGLCCSTRLGEMGLCWQPFSTKARPATVLQQHIMPTHTVTFKCTHKFTHSGTLISTIQCLAHISTAILLVNYNAL